MNTKAPMANAKRRKTQEDGTRRKEENGKRRKEEDVSADLQEKLKAMNSQQLSNYCHRLLINSQGNSKEYEYAYLLLIQQPRTSETIAHRLDRYINDPELRKQDEEDQEDATTGSNAAMEDEEDEEEEDEDEDEEETEDEESVDLTDEVDAVKEDDVGADAAGSDNTKA